MLIVKSPFRISLFGGSTDYKDYFEKKESFIIGTTIDKYVYMSIREKPKIFSNEIVLSYSILEKIKTYNDIKNPLIRETLKYHNLQFPIEFTSFTDIPSRTGLGGSSSFCVGLTFAVRNLLNSDISKKIVADDAIHIERVILSESGGIQDQIWASYGGTNSIQISKDGNFSVKPLPITVDFKNELENSMVLIYTNEQRSSGEIAKSHEEKNKDNILEISKKAYNSIIQEDIKTIGSLLYETWNEKKNISPLISNNNIDNIIDICMSFGAYGAKLLGSGGCGFVLVICNKNVKTKIVDTFKNNIMEFKFEKEGVSRIL
jgi:D-glycero-alpha-D-manno-heptose-7-phosphate kinase